MTEFKRAWDMENLRYVLILLIAENNLSLAAFVEGFTKTILSRVTISENIGNYEGFNCFIYCSKSIKLGFFFQIFELPILIVAVF